MSKNRGCLDFNDVIDELMLNSAYVGQFSDRKEFKNALLMLIKIIPEWLKPVYLSNKCLLKLHRGSGL
jgi:hypothetical protein